ncbi:2-hydroxyacid dehydrogenase [Fluviispira multicolorata]|uniref:2-hydroxyacid dehydrogenase n=1 Tax=Fluviispira multicolorata TaxID=2654512 RepID=A0A833JEH9_9BACT|nr:2-hydroxyacid dehydrogenase [Fluviispira multicolorata]KAB8033226.1 2-hydroxyacid dehydrogenase [Fluviispira multicolorata]
MNVIVFSTHSYEKKYFEDINKFFHHNIKFLELQLTAETASLAKGYSCVCAFVNDKINKQTIEALSEFGVKLIALRSVGFNHVDLKEAKKHNLTVVRVPEYSPYAVAEHSIALLLSLNRKIHKAYNRVHEFNFSLDGLTGFDLNKKTVGIIGTGRIGMAMAKIMNGFGCQVLAYDKYPNNTNENITYVSLNDLYQYSDIISLHIPLSKDSFHLLNKESFSKMKRNVIIINSSRGGLIDSRALIQALKRGVIKGAALDVYEEEESYFFSDFSEKGIDDDILARLISFPNVLITAHQAFLTHEALTGIVNTTLQNILDFENDIKLINQVQINEN